MVLLPAGLPGCYLSQQCSWGTCSQEAVSFKSGHEGHRLGMSCWWHQNHVFTPRQCSCCWLGSHGALPVLRGRSRGVAFPAVRLSNVSVSVIDTERTSFFHYVGNDCWAVIKGFGGVGSVSEQCCAKQREV
jgi:hypothetical protein